MVRNQNHRRQFLIGLGALSSMAPSAIANQIKHSFGTRVSANHDLISYKIKRDFSVVNYVPLRERAAAKGLIYGAFPSVDYYRLSQGDKQLRASFIRECGLLVGGFSIGTRPSASSFDFTETDALMQFAKNHGMLFQGNSLVSNQLIPQWLSSKFKNSHITSKELESILTNHVSTTVKRYAGQVHSWIVVNEAIWPEDNQRDGIRYTPWFQFLRANYIDLAFYAAKAADPNALLVYNGDHLEHDTSADEARRVATLNLLENLLSKGVPVQALGIQSHLAADKPLNYNKVRRFIRNIANLGLKILITELDVGDSHLRVNVTMRDRIVASIYEDYLSVVLDEPAVIAVSTWGLSDRYTWLETYNDRPDHAPLRPLPFDSNLKPKLAWNAMARAFDSSPKRALHNRKMN